MWSARNPLSSWFVHKSTITSRLQNRVLRSLPVEGIDVLRKRPIRLDCIVDSVIAFFSGMKYGEYNASR